MSTSGIGWVFWIRRYLDNLVGKIWIKRVPREIPESEDTKVSTTCPINHHGLSRVPYIGQAENVPTDFLTIAAM
ncbi:hypothetical protein PAAG_12650 [Paracoccidioides lutzii Pb01]|uniref:Uncharacterized protein n=1 Tax=Paracoccidioides lutzii (strain ATCC MYA-826 / Pb01) TaxID=502779 RepID=A0A0A2V2W9_PARBA|nr:hypothetical protein PAAG_12650 [Paracoccidioides lutzii Pb01]KGQ00687.1 hypothetical protein PAAG_12650 [Paracoccidioides lutzii Pb01]